MTYGGDALGRVDGKAIFVRGGIAGELVRAQVIEERGGFARARAVEVIEPVSERSEPRCPHFGFGTAACGGCHWQHIEYAAQRRFKTEIVREQFQRIGRIPDAPVREVISSPHVWAYRNHVQFSVAPDGHVGFQAARSNRIVPIDVCPIVEPPILDWLQSHPRAKPGAGRLDVRSFQSPITIKGVPLEVSEPSFFQVNTALVGTLVDVVMARLNLHGGESVLDAYCGVGLFGRFIAPLAGRVVGIESGPSAVQDARVNLAQFDHVVLYEGLVENVLPSLDEAIQVAVLDPPRAGCGPRVIQSLVERQVERMVYVSCDPSTLARDARQLMDGGYGLVDVQPLDMFPQTYHVETISTWIRI